MTSLSTQLRDISRPALVTPRQVDSKWQPSYLFEGGSAVEIDRETVLALAKNGFEELVSLEPSFKQFQRLFRVCYLERDRGMLTEEENEKLNIFLDRFIVRLSPYFPLRPTQKVFEWLISIHKVQHYNLLSLLECIFPYYRTNLFVRMVQLLPLSDKRSEWHWLKPIQKSNMPLSSISLVQHSISVPSFLAFICQLFSSTIPCYDQDGGQLLFHSSTNFYISTIVQVIQKKQYLNENLVQALLSSITLALKSQAEDVIAAGLIITSHLATNCLLSSALCTPLVRIVCHTATVLPREAIGCIAMLADTQPDFNLTRKCLRYLSKIPNHLEILIELDSTFKMDKLLICILSHYFDEIQCSKEQISNAVALLKNIRFDPNSIKRLFIDIIDRYISVMERADSESNGVTDSLVEFGRILAYKYSSIVKQLIGGEQLNCTISGHLTDNGVDEVRHSNGYITQYVLSIYLAWNESYNIGSETKLFLSLNHATAETRLAAMARIREQISTRGVERENLEFLRECLKERIKDDDPQVVLAVLEIGASLFQIFPPMLLVETLLDMCTGSTGIQSKSWRSCIIAALGLLCSEDSISSAPHHINAITLLLVDVLQLRAPTIKLNIQVNQLFGQFAIAQHQELFNGLPEFISASNIENFDEESPVNSLVSYNVSILNFISRKLIIWKSTSLECFFNFLITSQGEYKHTVTSMCIIALLFYSISKVKQYLYSLAPSFIKMLIESPLFFDILSSDYGNEEKITSKLQTILIDPTLNPKSDFVSRYAICRLGAWTLSSIITHIETSERFLPNCFWIDDFSDIGLDIKIIFSLLSLLIELELSKSSLRLGYKEIIQQILATHLNDSIILCTYVSNLLTLPAAATPLHRKITPEIRVYSLFLFNSFISSIQTTTESCQFLNKASLDSPIIPALLLQLISPNKFLRRLSLQCLQCICASQSDHPYRILASYVLECSTDIQTSSEFARLVFSNIGSGRIQTGKRRSKRLSQNSQSYPFDPIFSLLVGNSTPNHILSQLLSLLESIDTEHTYNTMCTMLGICIQQREQYGVHHTEIMNKLFMVCTPTIAPLFSADSEAIRLISNFLNSDFMQLHCSLILRFTSDFFLRLPSQTQMIILSLLFKILLDDSIQYLDSTVISAREVISTFTLTSAHICFLLKHNLGMELKLTETTLNYSPVRKKRKPGHDSCEHTLNPKPCNHVVSKFFEVLSKCQLSNFESIIPLYFKMLSMLQQWIDTADSETLDYNNNLLLSLMTQAIQCVSPSKLLLFEPTFDVLQIIHTIQNSLNVHVQVQGYILLSEAAKLMPDRIIHSIMPIFTFMGTNIVRNDDGYSFQVLIQAIETLIPPLVKIEGVNRPILSLVRAVLQVFVDAYSHIPSHRRVALFIRLVIVIGTQQYLYLLIILMILKDRKDKTSKMRAFVRSFLANFDTGMLLSTFVEMMRFLDCLEVNEENESENIADETGISEDCSPQQIFDLSLHIIEFLKNYIHNKHFVKKISIARSDGMNIDDYFIRMIEKGLSHFEKVLVADLEVAQLDLLNTIIVLLTTKQLVAVIKQMPDRFEPATIDKLLELLFRIIQGWNESSELKSLTELVELSSFLLKWSSSKENAVIGRKSALNSLTLIIRVLGPNCVDTLHKPIRKLLNILSYNHNHRDDQVLGEQLLVLSEFVPILKIELVPYLPQLIPFLIQKYRSSLLENISEDSTAYGCTSVFSQLLQHISNFLSPYLPELIAISVKDQLNSSDSVSEMQERMRYCIGTQVSFRIVLSNVQKVMTSLGNNISELSYLLSILGESLLHVQKSELTASHTSLHQLLLITLDFRSENTTQSEEIVSQVEEACAGVYINFVLKLSERTFKSLYLQLREWATSEEAPKQRLIPFYFLSHKLAKKLKSIFSIYLIFFIENACEVLNRTHLKTKTENQLLDDADKFVLLTNLFKCLENCLKFAQERIMTREHFDLLRHPLLSQLTNYTGGIEEFQTRVTTHFIPCLLQFAARADQDGMWKELTIEILIISKDSSPQVRFASLLTLEALFKHLGNGYLQVLPDTVPYLAELIEDESVEVEKQCQVVISTIESILGDSIQQYF